MLQRTLPTGFVAPRLPTKTDKLPSGSQWLQEIKYDGFRMLVRRDVAGVRLFTRNGHDWIGRFLLIARPHPLVAMCELAHSLTRGAALAATSWLREPGERTTPNESIRE